MLQIIIFFVFTYELLYLRFQFTSESDIIVLGCSSYMYPWVLFNLHALCFCNSAGHRAES